ncbi:sporulation protein YqfC [Rubeoparvulum massiliense]|uniref:sporulation protein YqfC n=1 Tax=Rubeoparvulum massiliense TaxID=1631346 RepID=UPI00065E7BE2|nr:sporulation protein YqfC [Rubeoparvulum massiliense]
MGKWSRRLQRFTTDILNIPEDAILNLPRITVIGTYQAYIENHHGVLIFNDDELRLLLKNGQLRIAGKNLSIRTIYKEELFLEGEITAMEFLSI